jgi:4'-phosphopantetheinyl transferase
MNSIKLYFTASQQKLPEDLFQFHLNKLPHELKVINSRYLRWQDRQAHLLGKILLQNGLKEYGYNNDVLKNLKYNKHNRPFLNAGIDFNLSHSGEYVICAIGENLRLGVDIEIVREINFKDFIGVMTTEQWVDINNSENPVKSFFKYWTIKESLIKADSRGLEIPLLDIHVKDNMINYDNYLWYLIPLYIDNNYHAHLTTNKKNVRLTIIKTDLIRDISLTEREEIINDPAFIR